jgi:hypothetical protein
MCKILIWNRSFVLPFENTKRQRNGFWLCCPRMMVVWILMPCKIISVFREPNSAKILMCLAKILTWRWPSTAETCHHRRTNKLRYFVVFLRTYPPSYWCVLHLLTWLHHCVYIYWNWLREQFFVSCTCCTYFFYNKSFKKKNLIHSLKIEVAPFSETS